MAVGGDLLWSGGVNAELSHVQKLMKRLKQNCSEEEGEVEIQVLRVLLSGAEWWWFSAGPWHKC